MSPLRRSSLCSLVIALTGVDCNLPGGAQVRGRMASDSCLPLQS